MKNLALGFGRSEGTVKKKGKKTRIDALEDRIITLENTVNDIGRTM
jgi:hypothetical protein